MTNDAEEIKQDTGETRLLPPSSVLGHVRSFSGAWLVREYIYNPDGTLAGTVRQRREVMPLPDGRLRVTQHCQPDSQLDGHPMSHFTGSPFFDLSVAPPYRYYHGPAVVGMGISWADGVMTGHGLWPEFGHNFRSFAVLATAERQLTGGKFFNATQMIANIVGLALPEETAADWPSLAGPQRPSELAATWVGTMETITPRTMTRHSQPVCRHYQTADRWHDEPAHGPATQWQAATADQRWRMAGQHGQTPVQGIGKQFGWLLEIEAMVGYDTTLQQMELFDATSPHLIVLRRWLVHDELVSIEMMRFKTEE